MAKITQEDALRQAREMHARARREPPPPPPPEPAPEPPQAAPAGPLDALFEDRERTMLLALLLLLSDEGNRPELVLALMVLLI